MLPVDRRICPRYDKRQGTCKDRKSCRVDTCLEFKKFMNKKENND